MENQMENDFQNHSENAMQPNRIGLIRIAM